MSGSSRYVPRNSRWFNRFLKMFYGNWLRRFYGVRTVHGELASLRPPYVVVANHVSIDDPFILGTLLHEPIYWVTSDGNMRTRIMKALLRLVGSIPKSKAIPDIETVNWIVEVIRKRKGAVGLFPEGQASWDGGALPLFPSTAKLLKILRAPVLAAVIKGGYLSWPRWARSRRRGGYEVEFRLLFTPADLKKLPSEEIHARLEKALSHDEGSWQASAGARFASGRSAENIESAFYVCPSCEAIGTLGSVGNRIACSACTATLRFGRDGRISSTEGRELPFATLEAWNRFQTESLRRRLAAFAGSGTPQTSSAQDRRGPSFFRDSGALLLRGFKANPLQRLGRGELELFADRLEFRRERRGSDQGSKTEGGKFVFPIDGIEGIGVLKRAILEFYVDRELYQLRFPSRSTSARKWLDAVTVLAEMRKGNQTSI